jgi:hypothetical protein
MAWVPGVFEDVDLKQGFDSFILIPNVITRSRFT